MPENKLFYHVIDSPLGKLFALASDKGLRMLEFREEGEIPSLLSQLGKTSGMELEAGANEVLSATFMQLQDYFNKKRESFDIPLEPQGSQFQQKVWQELLKVAYGRTTTYQRQALAMGNIMVIRAMAAANGKNPIAIIIPCHRVLGSDGSLTGYAGGLWRKKWLLEHEGALLVQGTLF